MADSLYDRTIAFAGICQAVALVQQVAKDGKYDTDAYEASLKSIINMNPSSTLDVYGNTKQLELGLKTLIKGIDGTQKGSEITRYIIGLITLENKLHANNESMSKLGNRLDTLERQTDHYDLFDTQMLSNIASVYLEVISPVGPRIQVAGSPEVLQQTQNQHKVRALLLAGIRSAVLWRQVGGKRMQLIFNRKKMIQQAQDLLKAL